MNTKDKEHKPDYKYVPCECCTYPIAVPAEASHAVCLTCPRCGNRSCS